MARTGAAVLLLVGLSAIAAAAEASPDRGFGELARVAPTEQKTSTARLWQSVGLDVTALDTPAASPAVVSSFTANPPAITAGESSTLEWSTDKAKSVSISGVGSVPLNGSVSVKPAVTTIYTLTATSDGGSATASTTVTVTPAGPRVVITSLPSGMVQVAGQAGAGDAFTVANLGTASTTIDLSQSGGFFTISPRSFVLPPGATETVAITALAQPAGSYEGSVTIAADGVAAGSLGVRLLSTAPPSGTVEPRPTQSREEVSAPPGQSVSGSVSFTNGGSSAVQAIAAADVPWITPQSGIITLPPGQTVAVTYTIDASKRPDAASPLGAVTGTISLSFLSGSGNPAAKATTPQTSTVSVTLVYVVPPGTQAGAPPALQPGQLALFIPGLANRTAATGDLLLLNKILNSDITDLKLYLQVPSQASALANIDRLPAAASALFPGLLKNVFRVSGSTASVQVRAPDITKVSVTGVQSNTSLSRGTFGTQLPVLRSDRGVASGGQIILSGVQKDEGVQTDLYLQELSGVVTTVAVDFLDDRGAVVYTRPSLAVGGFAMAELLDAAPSGAVVARVKNVGGGRIGAYGLVVTRTTGDLWLITDPGSDAAADGSVIVPLLPAGTGSDTSLYLTNRTAGPVTATVQVNGNGGRRRAVGRGTGGGAHGGMETDAANGIPLSSLQTFKLQVTGANAGFARIDFPAGAISATGRSVKAMGGSAGSLGTGLPAIPLSFAIGTGQMKRFAGIDEASAATRTARKPGTFRSSLLLIETANSTAVVRVTLHYTFAAGSKVSASATSSREYVVPASQDVLISELASDIIGAQRASFGDLRNMDLDIEVVSGGGKIIPVVRAIDNGSEDLVVRTD